VIDNVKALEVAYKWTPELEERINKVLENQPEADIDFRTWTPMKSRRLVAIDYNMKDKAIKAAIPK